MYNAMQTHIQFHLAYCTTFVTYSTLKATLLNANTIIHDAVYIHLVTHN